MRARGGRGRRARSSIRSRWRSRCCSSALVHSRAASRREVLRRYEELAALCRAHGIAQELQWAAPLRGRALVELGEIDAGLAGARGAASRRIRSRGRRCCGRTTSCLYAGALLRARQLDDAQAALDEAREVAEATSQRAYDAEHRRLQAEVLLAQGDRRGARRVYNESLEIARRQGATLARAARVARLRGFLIGAGRPAEAARSCRSANGSRKGATRRTSSTRRRCSGRCEL